MKKSILFFLLALLSLVAGAACHGLRTSGDPVKFKIGVIVGVTMIVLAVVFGVSGLILAIKGRK